MTSLKEITYYFSVFRKHLGRRLYVVFLLTGLAVIAETFGIAMLLPLLEMMENGEAAEESSRIGMVLSDMLHFLGIGESMIGIMIFIAGIFLAKGAVKFGEGWYKATLSADLLREMKAGLFRQYSNMDYSYYTARNTGHFINIISQQVNRLLFAFEGYKRFLSQVIITILYMAVAFMISWKFALMATVAGVLILYLFSRLNEYVKELSRNTSEENTTLHRQLVQTIQAFPYIAATGRVGRLGDKVMQSIYRLTGYYRNQQIAHSFTQALREPVAVLVILLIVIIQLAFFEARLAPILVSLVLIYRAMGHVITIQSSWQQAMNMIGGLEMVEKEFKELDHNQEKQGEQQIGKFSKEIRFEEVSYFYTDREEAVLKDITLQIPAKSVVAFFGPSGAGKTTLIDMLSLLLTPRSGRIVIDGLPHDQIDRSSWRRQIGYVPQETVIFDDTIANNISLWQSDAGDEQELNQKITDAAERANAMPFIRELPEGLQTHVGDRGVRLSGGQKQRLAIARELFKNPELLILDEATSSLDSDSERYIHESLQKLKGELTIVLIAHRISSIRHADQIFVMDKGEIASRGTYDELLATDPSFRRFTESQQV